MGDYDYQQDRSGCEYLSDIKFAPKQGEELLEKIAELHKTHKYDSSHHLPTSHLWIPASVYNSSS